MSEKRFKNDELLVSTDWLAEHQSDPSVRLVEVTPPGAGYTLGHLRGAVFLNLDQVLPGKEVPVEQAVARLAELGLSPDKKIIVYDEIGGPRAAQAFWLLEYLGFPHVAVLEGGIERWMAEGRPQTRVIPLAEPTPFAPILHETSIATAEWLNARLEDAGVLILDCRTPEEHAEGYIPGARNRPWDKTLTLKAHQEFRDTDQLKQELDDLGVSHDKEIITYCGTGQRSSHTYFTLRLLGYPAVRNYKGSWDEWQAREDLPKARKK